MTLMLRALITVLGMLSGIDSQAACTSPGTLQSIVDQAFAGQPKVAGISVSVGKNGCARFDRAVGKRDVAAGLAMTTTSKTPIGSLTKPVTASLILSANLAGKLGPLGLDTPLDTFFTAAELSKLTTSCSNIFQINAYDRQAGGFVPTVAACPNFHDVKLRHLLNSNDGLISYEELDANYNFLPDAAEYPLSSWFRTAGIPTFPALAQKPINAFGVLDLLNIYRQETATIGGQTRLDFPPSGGNTAYGLLGIIAERVFGLPYNTLVDLFIRLPLNLDKMILVATKPSASLESSEQIARGYFDTTGASALPPLNADTNGVYPIVTIAPGRKAVDTYNFDVYSITNSGGGAGALVTTPKGYLTFFNAYTSQLGYPVTPPPSFDNTFVQTGNSNGSGPIKYGYGVFRYTDPSFGGTVYEKAGATFGGVCLARRAVSFGVTAVVCTNQEGLFVGDINSMVLGLSNSLIQAAK